MLRFSSALVLVAGCAGEPAPVELRFRADPGPAGSERYVCFGFPVEALDGLDLGEIRFEAPVGPVTLHHVSLYASPAAIDDATPCESMPEGAVPMNVWAPGGGDVVLPDDMALVVPPDTTELVVQAHALRTADGEAPEAQVVLVPREGAARRAAWLPLQTPVPAIAPGTIEERSSGCIVDAELHVLSTWPHMHRAGIEFHGLVDVVPWDFEQQRAYPLEVTLAAGDAIETRCVWRNDTAEVILPGPGIDDEMCGQSLIVWPAEAAGCE